MQSSGHKDFQAPGTLDVLPPTMLMWDGPGRCLPGHCSSTPLRTRHQPSSPQGKRMSLVSGTLTLQRCSRASVQFCVFWTGDAECVYLDLMTSTFREGFHHGRLRRLIKPRSGSSWTVTQMFPLAFCFIGSIHSDL